MLPVGINFSEFGGGATGFKLKIGIQPRVEEKTPSTGHLRALPKCPSCSWSLVGWKSFEKAAEIKYQCRYCKKKRTLIEPHRWSNWNKTWGIQVIDEPDFAGLEGE